MGAAGELGFGLGAGLRFITGHHVGGGVGDLAAGFTHHKPGGDAVAPPQLAGNAPVADVGEPVAVDLAPALRHEAGIGVLERLTAAGRQGLGFDKPLGGEQGLHRHLAAVGKGHAVAVVLHRHQEPLRLHGRHHRLAGLEAIQPREATGGFIHGAVLGHHRDQRQVVALANGEVVGVVGGGHLHAAGAEGRIHVVVGHDRNLAAHQRQGEGLAHQGGIAGILGVHRHGGVPQQGFRTGGGHLQEALAAAERIAEVPEVAVHLLHLHLQVAHRRPRSGAPIHQVFPAVDQPLLVQPVEGLHHRRAAAVVEGEALPPPIHGIAEAPQLAHDRAAAFSLPLPGLLQEGPTAQVLFAQPVGLELPLEDGLHRDRGMVGAGQTQHVLALQALEAHDRVDQGRVEGVAHVQAAGDVRRRDHHRERFTGGGRIGMESPALLPGPLPAGLGAHRVVGLGQGVGHGGGHGQSGHARKRAWPGG